jgi:hypothetical protein
MSQWLLFYNSPFPCAAARPAAVGFATSLDRRVNLMDAAAPCFLYHTLTGRVSGRLYM